MTCVTGTGGHSAQGLRSLDSLPGSSDLETRVEKGRKVEQVRSDHRNRSSAELFGCEELGKPLL